MISNRVLHHEKPCWMYRDEPNQDSDSGWRVFVGDEEEEYLNDASNFSLVSAEELISIDSKMEVLLHAPVGTSFEKENGEWRPVEMGGLEEAHDSSKE